MKVPVQVTKKRLLFAFLAGFTAIGIITLVITSFRFKTSITSPLADVLAETHAEEPIPASLEEVKTLGVLLLGFGGAGHDGGYLMDAIQLLHIDFERSVISLISIPRDLWVKMPSGKEDKINAVVLASSTDKKNLVASGAPTLKKVVSEITGLKTDYFIGVDFVGFERAVGIHLDGLEVDVAEPLDDPWYPIKGEELNLCDMSPAEITEVHQKYTGFELERQFACRYKHIQYSRGTHHMEGGDALAYVRSRHGSAEGDVSRGKRQQELIKAIKKKLFQLNTLDSLPGFFGEITKNTQSDIDLKIVEYLVPLLKKANEFKVVTVNLSTSNVLSQSKAATGAFIMTTKQNHFNWQLVKEYIQQELSKDSQSS